MNSWYYSKDGAREGPVNAAQIVALVNSAALDPATTQVWREGLPDWVPLGRSTVFNEARSIPVPTASPTSAPIQSAAPANPYAVSSQSLAASRADRPDMPLEYPGIGRLAYFVIWAVLCVIFYAILFVFIFAALGTNSGGGLAMAGFLVALLFVAGFVVLAVKRLANVGMSGWAILWALVPIMNIWIQWRLIACPAGYEDHRTLDTAGKVITGIWIGFFVLGFIGSLMGGARG